MFFSDSDCNLGDRQKRSGIFGSTALGGVIFMSQLTGTLAGAGIAVTGGLVFGSIKAALGLHLSEEDEYQGANLSIYKIAAYPEEEMSRR